MGVEERTGEEDGSVLPTLSINTSGHGTNFEKNFCRKKAKKKRFKKIFCLHRICFQLSKGRNEIC